MPPPPPKKTLPTWKVKLHLVSTDVGAKPAAKLTDTFGVEAKDHDRARAAATKWLKDRGYTIRAMNFTAPARPGDPAPRELIAYVLPPKEAPRA